MPPYPLHKPALRQFLRLLENHAPPSSEHQTARAWAVAAGLADRQGLTTIGQLVITKDPYLETTVTDWLMHFQLSSHERFWNCFVYEFLSSHLSFTETELNHYFAGVFLLETPDQLRKKVRSILRSYIDSEAIPKSSFLSRNEKNYSIGNPGLSNPYTTGYLLARVWERNFGTQESVFVENIFNIKENLSSLLGISREHLNQQLNVLEKHEIIERRSAKPYLLGDKPQMVNEEESFHQIYRCWSKPAGLLEKAYDNDKATPNRPLIQSLGSILDEDDETPDFSQFLEWVSGLVALAGGSNTITKLAS